MAPGFRAAAFDLDGTIIDTSEGVLRSIEYTVEKFGYERLPDDVLRSFIGPPIYDSFERVFHIGRDKSHEMVTVFRERYLNWGLFRAEPYDGIFDVFRELSEAGVKPVVATYKMEDYAVLLLKHFGFDRYTDIIYGSDAANTLTKGQIIRKAVTAAGADDMAQAVMIGDSENDAKGAIEAGTAFIGVTYGLGFTSPAEVNAFDNVGIASSVKEISGIILNK